MDYYIRSGIVVRTAKAACADTRLYRSAHAVPVVCFTPNRSWDAVRHVLCSAACTYPTRTSRTVSPHITRSCWNSNERSTGHTSPMCLFARARVALHSWLLSCSQGLEHPCSKGGMVGLEDAPRPVSHCLHARAVAVCTTAQRLLAISLAPVSMQRAVLVPVVLMPTATFDSLLHITNAWPHPHQLLPSQPAHTRMLLGGVPFFDYRTVLLLEHPAPPIQEGFQACGPFACARVWECRRCMCAA